MSDSKTGSKNDVNESNMPLLDDDKAGEPAPEKETIELSEKDDSKESEKKVKKTVKVKMPKGPNCFTVKTAGLNLNNRDEQDINTEIDIGFDDVLAEPRSAHGFAGMWKTAFVLFSQTKKWLYRLFSALIAIPLALIWAVIFAVVSVLYIWIGTPLLKLFEFGVYLVRRVWTGILSATLEPVCEAIGTIWHPRPTGPNYRIVNTNASNEALELSVKKMMAEV